MILSGQREPATGMFTSQTTQGVYVVTPKPFFFLNCLVTFCPRGMGKNERSVDYRTYNYLCFWFKTRELFYLLAIPYVYSVDIRCLNS